MLDCIATATTVRTLGMAQDNTWHWS